MARVAVTTTTSRTPGGSSTPTNAIARPAPPAIALRTTAGQPIRPVPPKQPQSPVSPRRTARASRPAKPTSMAAATAAAVRAVAGGSRPAARSSSIVIRAGRRDLPRQPSNQVRGTPSRAAAATRSRGAATLSTAAASRNPASAIRTASMRVLTGLLCPAVPGAKPRDPADARAPLSVVWASARTFPRTGYAVCVDTVSWKACPGLARHPTHEEAP
jgi:hypothetical protein